MQNCYCPEYLSPLDTSQFMRAFNANIRRQRTCRLQGSSTAGCQETAVGSMEQFTVFKTTTQADLRSKATDIMLN